MNLLDFQGAQRVRYVPHHAHGDLMHADCEDGTVSSVGARFVFVRFDRSVQRLGWREIARGGF